MLAEYSAETLDKNFSSLTDAQIIELSGLIGGYSAIFTGNAVGLDDSEVADNIFSGQRIGKNAAENNYLMPQEKADLMKELRACDGDGDCRDEVQNSYKAIHDKRGAELLKARMNCSGYGIDCDKVDHFFVKQRIDFTKDGNELYLSLDEQERAKQFILLPDEKAIYHTYQIDPVTHEVINVLAGSQQGYQKYVHKTMGYEVVIDTNNHNNIVTDHLNMGTYNYYNPAMDGVALNPLINGNFSHGVYDTIPYYFDGNSTSDPTLMLQRITRGGNLLFIKNDKSKKN